MRQENSIGLTLIELLVTIVILTMLVSLALPGFVTAVTGYQQNTVTKNYFSALQYARQSAIFRNQLVTVCPISQGTCSEDWSHPVAIFLDPTNQRTPSVSSSEILKIIDTSPESTSITIRPAAKPYFQFRPDGTTHGTPGSVRFLHLSGDTTEEHQIVISLGGRIRMSL